MPKSINSSSVEIKKVKKQTKKPLLASKSISEVVSGVSVLKYNTDGKETGNVLLPNALFHAKVNSALLAQAIRIYQTNLRVYPALAKSRGEVAGSKKKIYKQKGTGRARHGGKRAPIFVHGGVAHGPKKKYIRLTLPKKMKFRALTSALTLAVQNKMVKVIENIHTHTWKTHDYTLFFQKIGNKGKVLLILSQAQHDVMRNTRNLDTVSTLYAKDINAYIIMKHQSLLFTSESIKEISNVFLKEKTV